MKNLDRYSKNLPKVVYEQSVGGSSREAERMVQEAFNFLFEETLENYNKKHTLKFGQGDSSRLEKIKIPPIVARGENLLHGETGRSPCDELN